MIWTFSLALALERGVQDGSAACTASHLLAESSQPVFDRRKRKWPCSDRSSSCLPSRDFPYESCRVDGVILSLFTTHPFVLNISIYCETRGLHTRIVDISSEVCRL